MRPNRHHHANGTTFAFTSDGQWTIGYIDGRPATWAGNMRHAPTAEDDIADAIRREGAEFYDGAGELYHVVDGEWMPDPDPADSPTDPDPADSPTGPAPGSLPADAWLRWARAVEETGDSEGAAICRAAAGGQRVIEATAIILGLATAREWWADCGSEHPPIVAEPGEVVLVGGEEAIVRRVSWTEDPAVHYPEARGIVYYLVETVGGERRQVEVAASGLRLMAEEETTMRPNRHHHSIYIRDLLQEEVDGDYACARARAEEIVLEWWAAASPTDIQPHAVVAEIHGEDGLAGTVSMTFGSPAAADQVAEILENDGERFERTSDGRTLDQLACDAGGWIDATDHSREAVRYRFHDDSCLTVVGAAWSIGYPCCWGWEEEGHAPDCPVGEPDWSEMEALIVDAGPGPAPAPEDAAIYRAAGGDVTDDGVRMARCRVRAMMSAGEGS